MRSVLLSTTVAILMATPAVAGEVARVLVCPPELSYCYYKEKPIRPDIAAEDIFREIDRAKECWKKAMPGSDCTLRVPR
jgi:hypothetical protein